MARNSSGVYSLPAGINPVVSGTVVSSAWANPTLADVATELTNSLDRQGRGGMLAAFRGFDGSAAAPGVSFSNESSSGMYRPAAGQVAISVSGTQRALFDAAGLTVSALVASGDISAANAVISGLVTAPNIRTLFGGNGQVRMTGGGGSNSGYIEFNCPTTFVRQGYIGFSSSSGSLDTGSVNYAAGTHAFVGAITQNGVAIPTLSLPIDTVTGTGTIPSSANGRCVRQTDAATRTVDTATAGQIVTVINDNAAAQTLNQGSGVTLRLAGSGTSGTRSLNPRAVCTLVWVTSAIVYASGPGVL